MSFDGPRDWVAVIAAALLIIVGALTFFGISIPYLAMIVAVLFILGGLFGIFDAFSVDAIPMRILYIVVFLAVVLMGIDVFFPIPYLSMVFSLIPGGITHYIVNAIVAVLLIVDAVQSD